MSTSSHITGFFITRFWPFFRKYIWPLIQDEVIKSVKDTIQLFAKKYEDFIYQNERKAHQAQAQAAAAEAKAAGTSDTAEAEKYRAIAEVWRQVAEDFRAENEWLKAERDDFKKQANEEAEKSVKDIGFTITANKVQLTSGNRIIALPSPTDKQRD